MHWRFARVAYLQCFCALGPETPLELLKGNMTAAINIKRRKNGLDRLSLLTRKDDDRMDTLLQKLAFERAEKIAVPVDARGSMCQSAGGARLCSNCGLSCPDAMRGYGRENKTHPSSPSENACL